ncbi:MAG: hypothetical protein GY697_27070 [Desulfobacterales bacterium]|nr:hypothetical protein [Desulfobacterales bacterium]
MIETKIYGFLASWLPGFLASWLPGSLLQEPILKLVDATNAIAVKQREKLTSFSNKSARNIDHLPGM